MNNIQGGHVTCYICEVQAVGGEFLKSRSDGCLIESATVPLPPV